MRVIIAVCIWMVFAGAGLAEPSAAGLFAARQPLFTVQGETTAKARLASLFMDEADGGLFAALPGRREAPLRQGGGKAARLHDLIARAEAGPMGYDAVQHGARVKPPKRPTDMSLGEIFAWIAATPGQPHAIGRYQFIPATLRHSVKRLGLPPETRFSPEVQDRLANLLLGDAGFLKAQTGEITAETFMLNLAKIWAGLPLPSGRSYYQGYAGNTATMEYAVFAREVRAILDG
ncbi:hypothetical protein [Roseovarius bejariae]|nr:hypothetical protein [Roseovarius bejariae]